MIADCQVQGCTNRQQRSEFRGLTFSFPHFSDGPLADIVLPPHNQVHYITTSAFVCLPLVFCLSVYLAVCLPSCLSLLSISPCPVLALPPHPTNCVHYIIANCNDLFANCCEKVEEKGNEEKIPLRKYCLFSAQYHHPIPTSHTSLDRKSVV